MGIYIIAITGASGAPYARQLSRRILDKGHQIKMVISDAGRTVLKVEESVERPKEYFENNTNKSSILFDTCLKNGLNNINSSKIATNIIIENLNNKNDRN